LAEEITLLPKPKLKLWIVCPYCGYKFYTYKKKFRKIICPNCKASIATELLESSTYYYDRKNNLLKKYPLSVTE